MYLSGYVKDAKGKDASTLEEEAIRRYQEMRSRADVVIENNEDIISDLRKTRRECMSLIDKSKAEIELNNIQFLRETEGIEMAELIALSKKYSAINNDLRKTIDMAESTIKRADEGIKDSEAIIKYAERVRKFAARNLKQEKVLSEIVGGCNEIIGTVNSQMNKMANMGRSLWEDVRDGVTQTAEKAVAGLDALGTKAVDNAKQAIETVKEDFAQLKSDVRDMGQRIRDKFKSWGEAIKNSTPVRNATKASDFVIGAAIMFGNKASSFAKEAAETGKAFREGQSHDDGPEL